MDGCDGPLICNAKKNHMICDEIQRLLANETSKNHLMRMSQKWKQEPHTFQTTLQKSKGKHIRIIPSNEGLLPILTKQLNLKFQQMETFTPFKSKDVDLHDVIPNSLLMVYIVAHRHAQDITSCLPKSPKMTRRDPLKTRKKSTGPCPRDWAEEATRHHLPHLYPPNPPRVVP